MNTRAIKPLSLLRLTNTSHSDIEEPEFYLKSWLVVSVRSVDGIQFQEDASRVFRTGVHVFDFPVRQEDGYGGDQDDDPGDADGRDSVALRPDGHGSYRMNDGQEAVQRHQHEGVDAGVRRHHYQILHHLAPEIAERPEREYVVGGRERNAEHDETEIGDGQIDDEEVGGAAHLLVGGDDDDDESVAEQTQHDDDAEQDGHDDGDDLLHPVEFRFRFVRR